MEQFGDLDADLPALTQLILSPAFAIIVVVLPVLTVVGYLVPSSKAQRLTWHTLAIVLVLAMAALCTVALYLPTIPIGQRLGYCERRVGIAT